MWGGDLKCDRFLEKAGQRDEEQAVHAQVPGTARAPGAGNAPLALQLLERLLDYAGVAFRRRLWGDADEWGPRPELGGGTR